MAFTDFNNMPGLYEKEFFDFGAASIEPTLFQDDNDSCNMASQAQPVQSYHSTSIMPLTQAEIDAIVAMRNNKETALEKYERENPFGFGMPAPTYNNKGISTIADYFGSAVNPEQAASSTIEEGIAPDHTVVTPNNMGQPGGTNILLQSGWKPGNKCPRPKCSSKAKFKSLHAIETHITNIHLSPLLCNKSGCIVKTPFGRASDLRRHHQSAHNSGVREFVCPLPKCVKDFARKDHLTKHMREQHTTYPCPFNHCRDAVAGRFVLPEHVENHILSSHGKYECVLGDCAKTSSSEFGRVGIHSHLACDHGYTSSARIVRRADAAGGDLVTITQDHLGSIRLRECKKCSGEATTNSTNPLSG